MNYEVALQIENPRRHALLTLPVEEKKNLTEKIIDCIIMLFSE